MLQKHKHTYLNNTYVKTIKTNFLLFCKISLSIKCRKTHIFQGSFTDYKSFCTQNCMQHSKATTIIIIKMIGIIIIVFAVADCMYRHTTTSCNNYQQQAFATNQLLRFSSRITSSQASSKHCLLHMPPHWPQNSLCPYVQQIKYICSSYCGIIVPQQYKKVENVQETKKNQ